jgi:hypothetical protein
MRIHGNKKTDRDPAADLVELRFGQSASALGHKLRLCGSNTIEILIGFDFSTA